MGRGNVFAGLAVSLLALMLIALAGCGSGGPESPTKEEFIARGDAICAQGQAEAAELARRAQEVQAQTGTLSEAEVIDRTEAIWRDQIDLVERFHGQVADLGSPEGDEARVDEFLRSLTDGLTVAREIHSTLEDGESPSRELVQEYFNIVVRGNTLAQAYGFTVCGRSG